MRAAAVKRLRRLKMKKRPNLSKKIYFLEEDEMQRQARAVDPLSFHQWARLQCPFRQDSSDKRMMKWSPPMDLITMLVEKKQSMFTKEKNLIQIRNWEDKN